MVPSGLLKMFFATSSTQCASSILDDAATVMVASGWRGTLLGGAAAALASTGDFSLVKAGSTTSSQNPTTCGSVVSKSTIPNNFTFFSPKLRWNLDGIVIAGSQCVFQKFQEIIVKNTCDILQSFRNIGGKLKEG